MTTAATRPVSIAVIPPVPIEGMRRFVQEPAGDWTLEDVVAATGLEPDSVTVSIDGSVIEREVWSTTTPRPGQSVIVSSRPGVQAIFAFIGAGVAAIGIGGTAATIITAFVTAVVVVGVSYGLSALSQALLAPSEPDTDSSAPGVRRTIAGSSNTWDPYAPVPQVLGKHRFYPTLAARSYTTVEDGRLYLYQLFTFGYGQLAITDLKIGDEPLFRSNSSIVYTGVLKADTSAFGGTQNAAGVVTPGKVIELEVRAGTGSDAAITLFATNVQEQVVAKPLTRSRGAITQRTKSGATRITVICSCPNGLIWRTDTGGTKPAIAVRLGISYRLATSSGAWTSVDDIVLKAATLSSVHGSRSFDVTEGTYDVRVVRETEDNASPLVVNTTEWTSMLVNRSGSVTNETGLCLVAMKTCLTGTAVHRTDQFNGIAQTVIPDWDSGTSTWITRATSNPASVFRHVLQGRANKRAIADARINLTALAAWHVECASKSFGFNYVTQGRVTVLDMLRNVAAAGRASPGVQDGKFSVILENPLTGAPVQHFGPRNVRSFREVRRYVTTPQALRAQFIDPDSGYLDTERIVPADGYTVSTATTFERLDQPGITSSDQAYKLGRYHLAVLAARPADFVIDTDFEFLDCVRGDWVKFNHDAILVGLAAGRVVSVTMSGADCSGVVVDQQCPMAAAAYGIRFRKSDGSTIVKVVNTVAGNQTTLTFSSVIAGGNPMPVAGDLFLFGVSGSESIDLVVKDIEPIDDLGARLTLVDAAAGILTADSGAIPTYVPQITIPPGRNPPYQVKPRIASCTSTDVREQEARGPVTERGIRVQFQTSGTAVKP